MPISPRVTFRNLDTSPALTTLIEERAAKLSELHEAVLSCEVAIEAPHGHHAKGEPFHVRVLLSMRKAPQIVVEENNEDCHVAIRDAFSAARRRIEDRAQRLQSRRRA